METPLISHLSAPVKVHLCDEDTIVCSAVERGGEKGEGKEREREEKRKKRGKKKKKNLRPGVREESGEAIKEEP